MSSELSLAEIKDLLSGGKTRLYKPTIIDFVSRNEVYIDCMENPAFAEKKIDAVMASFGNNLKILRLQNPDWPVLQVKKVQKPDGKFGVFLVNVTLLQGQLAEQKSESK